MERPICCKLRRHAIRAQQLGQSLIILPCHKSHVDYLLISYLFIRLGFAVPHIAAGDNLDLPVVGYILRHGGAFFIRRSWEGDMMYTELAREYVEVRAVTERERVAMSSVNIDDSACNIDIIGEGPQHRMLYRGHSKSYR